MSRVAWLEQPMRVVDHAGREATLRGFSVDDDGYVFQIMDVPGVGTMCPTIPIHMLYGTYARPRVALTVPHEGR